MLLTPCRGGTECECACCCCCCCCLLLLLLLCCFCFAACCARPFFSSDPLLPLPFPPSPPCPPPAAPTRTASGSLTTWAWRRRCWTGQAHPRLLLGLLLLLLLQLLLGLCRRRPAGGRAAAGPARTSPLARARRERRERIGLCASKAKQSRAKQEQD